MLTLDVVVPTYNRSELLAKTVDSLLQAELPAELSVTIIVVDNNSTDDTATTVQRKGSFGPIRLRYVKEPKQGVSNARNAGIAAGSGELIAFIDDDEQIDPAWYKVIKSEFADARVEFIGGPYFPIWGADAPDWLPPRYLAVIGISPHETYREYNVDFPGMLWGGNAVVRRSVFQRIGGYSPHMGRTKTGLLDGG